MGVVRCVLVVVVGSHTGDVVIEQTASVRVSIRGGRFVMVASG